MKNILLITIVLLITPVTKAQTLYTENFENFTLGNLGTDQTGTIPGQYGWYTQTFSGLGTDYASIVQEPNKSKVLVLSSHRGAVRVKKTDLNAFVDQRTEGYDVIKFEIEYYTGEQQIFTGSSSGRQKLVLSYDPTIFLNKRLLEYSFDSTTGDVNVVYNNGIYLKTVSLNNVMGSQSKLPFNTWVTFITYLDYNNKKCILKHLYFNTVTAGDFLADKTSVNLIEDFKPLVLLLDFAVADENNITLLTNKYDNIKITALKEVPPHVLSAENFLAEKFNLYPNPATNVVNITNSENMLVQQIAVYDTAGKLIKTENYNNQPEIQLNIEHLPSGTYMLHIKTNEGTAVKKLVKK